MVTKREETAENRRSEERREKVLFVRLSASELSLCRRAAADVDCTMGEWARALLIERAKRAKAVRTRDGKK